MATSRSVDLDQALAGLHVVARIHQDVFDDARDARAHLHLSHGLDGSRRDDDAFDCPALLGKA